MNRLKTRAFHFAAGAVVVSGLALMTPHAAHVIAFLLVQVENTAANPAITQGVEKQAAHFIQLRAEASVGRRLPFYVVVPDAAFGGFYADPKNRTLGHY